MIFKKEEYNSYGKIILGSDSFVNEIIEQRELNSKDRYILCNSGVFCGNAKIFSQLLPRIKNNNKKKEFYLTDIFKIASTNNFYTRTVIGEEKDMNEIKKGAPYSIPMTLVTGVVDALKELKIKKLVVGTPYLDEINVMESKFLEAKGFEVLDIQGLNLETGVSFGRVTPEYWKKFALEIDSPKAEAIFSLSSKEKSTPCV